MICILYMICNAWCVCAQSCLTLYDPMDFSPLSMNFPGKSTAVDCHFLLQGIFPTQGLNPCVLCHPPALAGGFLTTMPPYALYMVYFLHMFYI